MKRIPRWAYLCLGLLCAFLSISSVHAASVENHVHTAAPTVYTIQWFDASNHVIKTWRGNQTDAEKIKQHEQAIRKNLLNQQPRQSSKVLPFINRTDCSLPNGFFMLRNQGLVCFANDGSAFIGVYSVYEVDSGNNSGVFGWGFFCPGHYGGALCQWGNISMNHYSTVFPPLGTLWYVWQINISGR